VLLAGFVIRAAERFGTVVTASASAEAVSRSWGRGAHFAGRQRVQRQAQRLNCRRLSRTRTHAHWDISAFRRFGLRVWRRLLPESEKSAAGP